MFRCLCNVKCNEDAQNIAKISQILFALKRTLDILQHSHLKEQWKSVQIVPHRNQIGLDFKKLCQNECVYNFITHTKC